MTRYAYFDVFVERVLSKRKYASNLEAIRDLLRAQVLCGNYSDPLLQVQVLQAQFNTHGAYVTEESRPIHQYAKRLLRQGIEAGEIHSSHDVEHTVQLLFQVSRGILYDWALREDSFPLERQIDLALDLLLPSLARPMPPVTPPSDTEDFAAWQSEYFKEKGWLE